MLIAVSLVLLVRLLCYWLSYSLCYLLCHCLCYSMYYSSSYSLIAHYCDTQCYVPSLTPLESHSNCMVSLFLFFAIHLFRFYSFFSFIISSHSSTFIFIIIIIIILNRPHTHPNTILLISVLLSNIVNFRNHRLALMLADGDVSGGMSQPPIETWDTANCKPTDDVVSFWFPSFGQNITLNYTIPSYYLQFFTLNQSIGYIFSWL